MLSFCFSIFKKVVTAIKNIFIRDINSFSYFQCNRCLSFFKEPCKKKNIIERFFNQNSMYGVCELTVCKICGLGTVHRVSIV